MNLRSMVPSRALASPDTSRIQSALNACAGSGKAVVLAANGASNAFLAGPLTVGGSEVLVINPRLIQSNNVNNFTVYDLSLTNSPNFHLVFNGGTGFTVWGHVTINNSYIQDGDDGRAIKASNFASQNMTIENSHFYGTHGISIGSETNPFLPWPVRYRDAIAIQA